MLYLKLVGTFTVASSLVQATLADSASNWQRPFSHRHLPFHIDRVLTPVFAKDIEFIVEKYGIPGLTLGIVRPDGEIEHGAWWKKSEDGDAMTTNTLFRVGSCSKAFVSAAVGILIDDFAHGRNTTPLPAGLEKLDWDTKLKDLFPEDWKLMDPWASEKANLVDIFSHVSGMPRHDLAYGPSDTTAGIMQRMRYLRPAFELREKWSYNNQMFMVGAHLVSTYGAGTFPGFVHRRIFTPVGMTSSTYSPNTAQRSGAATHAWSVSGRRIPWWYTEHETETIAGPGGVISSAEDMSKWLRCIVNYGVDPRTNVTVIPYSAFKMITTAHAVAAGHPSSPDFGIDGYGLGWSRSTYAGHDIIYHAGSLYGFSAFAVVAPSDGLGLIVLANADWKYPANGEIAFLLARRLFDLEKSATLTDLTSPPAARTNEYRKRDEYSDLPPYDFTGAYYDDGYGSILFCNSSGISPYCNSVLSPLQTLAPTDPFSNRSLALLARFQTARTSHIRFMHLGGTRFHVDPVYLFPEGYGLDTTPFEWSLGGSIEAAFVVENGSVVGFGLSGMVPECRTTRERQGGLVEHTADVWFAKA